MPLLGTGPILGLALGAAGGVDAPGLIKAQSLGTALAAWILSNCRTGRGTMTGTGGNVSGEGTLNFAQDADDPIAGALTNFSTLALASASFGSALAASIPAADAAGIVKWTVIANSLLTHMVDHAGINPISFAYPTVPGGPVTGVGQVGFGTILMDPLLSTAMGFVDAPNIATWALISSVLINHIATNATALSLGFTCPPGGGPLVGVSLIG
jgi:hypothetical protein